MKHLAIITLLALAGCTTTQVEYKETAKVKTPANAAVPCDQVPAAPPRGSNFGTVYDFASDMVGLYGECAARDAAKLEFLRSQGH